MLNFFYSLDTALDMWLYFTSGYYSKDDKQTKCTNQTLKQYFYVYCNYQQDNWSELLLFAEFTYNNASSATTSVFLFSTNKKYYLDTTVYPEHDIASSWAYNFAIDLNKLQSCQNYEAWTLAFSFNILFLFLFDLFFYFELRVRVRVTRSHYHTSVTSDDMVTVIVTSHEIIEKDNVIQHVIYILISRQTHDYLG